MIIDTGPGRAEGGSGAQIHIQHQRYVQGHSQTAEQGGIKQKAQSGDSKALKKPRADRAGDHKEDRKGMYNLAWSSVAPNGKVVRTI